MSTIGQGKNAAVASAYERDGVQYVRHVAQLFRPYKERTFDFLDARPGQRLLDVGCGAGDDAIALSKRVGPSGQVAGVDASAEMIRAARARADGEDVSVEFTQGDALALPFPDDAF